MGCETADHWVIKKVQNGDCAAVQYLAVEEASQINVQLWADLCVAKQRGDGNAGAATRSLEVGYAQRGGQQQPLDTHREQEVGPAAVRLHPASAPGNATGQAAGGGAGRRPCALPPDRL